MADPQQFNSTELLTALQTLLSNSAGTSSSPKAGTMVNSMPVLDWNTFEEQLLRPIYGEGKYNRQNHANIAADLGWNIGRNANVRIKDVVDSFIDNTGGDLAAPDYTRLLDTAKKENIDLKGYTRQEIKDFGEGVSSNIDVIDYERLNRDLVKKSVGDKIKDPNTIYSIVGNRIRTDSFDTKGGDYNTTIYYKKVNDKLIPLARNDTKDSSTWVEFRDQGLPAIAGAIMPAFAPAIGGALGVSNAVGGLIGKAGLSLLQGKNPLPGIITSLIPNINVGNPILNMVANRFIKTKIGNELSGDTKKAPPSSNRRAGKSGQSNLSNLITKNLIGINTPSPNNQVNSNRTGLVQMLLKNRK